MTHIRLALLIFLFTAPALILSGCAAELDDLEGDSKSTVVSRQEGMASWYGPGFHGGKTANGETFNQNSMTAAHLSLPFHTCVRVTNKNNGQSVIVRINNRGPHIRGRIIDLSVGAAKKIGMYSSGVAPVKIEALEGAECGGPQNKHTESKEHCWSSTLGEQIAGGDCVEARGKRFICKNPAGSSANQEWSSAAADIALCPQTNQPLNVALDDVEKHDPRYNNYHELCAPTVTFPSVGWDGHEEFVTHRIPSGYHEYCYQGQSTVVCDSHTFRGWRPGCP